MSVGEAVRRLERAGHQVLLGQEIAEGLSNRAFRVVLDGRDGALRWTRGPRGTRLTAGEEVAAMAAAGPLAPEILAWADGVLVTAWIPRTKVDARGLGRALAHLHTLPTPDLRVLELPALLRSLDGSGALDAWGAEVAEVEATLVSGPPRFCHHDVTRGNVRAGADGVVFLDWEYAAVSDPAFDVECARRWVDDPDALLAAYGEAGGPGRPSPAMALAVDLLDAWWTHAHGGP